MGRTRRRALTALAVYAVAALVLLLSPGGPSAALGLVVTWIREAGWTDFRQGWVEVPANIALFLPFGFLLTVVLRRWWCGALIGIALSVCVELVQIVLPERTASTRDVLANGAGAAIGALIAWLTVVRRRRGGVTDQAPASS